MTAVAPGRTARESCLTRSQHRALGLPVTIRVSRFQPPDGIAEFHLTLQTTRYADLRTQLDWLQRGYLTALESLGLSPDSAVFRRLFASDPANQHDTLLASPLSQPDGPLGTCAVSLVGQPPIGPSKIALWAYHLRDPQAPLTKSLDGSTLLLQRGRLAHLWTTGLVEPQAAGPHHQTLAILTRYRHTLERRHLTLDRHLLRTWFFVRDIDTHYRGLVEARRQEFARHGLTAQTHYIASSGIGGVQPDPQALVMMDAYAVEGIQPRQVRYLQAPDRLCPTEHYGVTFERATEIAYRDRRHVILSGTASIDHQGAILHPGDVARQLDRTLENIAALLGEAGCTPEDMASWIVYVRDPADGPSIRAAIEQSIGPAPIVFVAAPVCRPGWLLEIEGWAITPSHAPDLPEF